MRPWFVAALLGACVPAAPTALPPATSPTAAPRAPDTPTIAADEPDDPDDDERFAWQDATLSPRSVADAPGPADLQTLCPAGDGALAAVAQEIANRQASGRPALDSARVTFALRAAGSPYVWPRVWSIEGAKLDAADTRARVQRWLASFNDGGRRRCAFSSAEGADGKRVIAGVAIDALADLESLPTRVRAGQWLTVRAHLLAPATDAHVVVLGPTGAPRTVTTSLDAGTVRATFSVDHPGPWVVQVVTSGRTGPRPVVEAMTFADQQPPPRFHAQPAPGEAAGAAHADAAAAVAAMVDAARQSEGLSLLTRDGRLDRVAQAHADAMRSAHQIGHDVGDGDPGDRIRAAGLAVRVAGENVAHARTIRRAHRALWASPSHRGNLLEPAFRRLGVGVASDPDGSVWVCEVLAAFR